MAKRSLFFLSITLLMLSSCKRNNDQEVRNVIETFYKRQNMYHEEVNKLLLSTNLRDLLEQVITKEKLSIEQIQGSANPTDKPDIIEGDLFTGLYEGPTSLTIEKIEFTGTSTATVTVQFTNSFYKESWQDRIILVNENGWKIDNVIFRGKNDNTQKVLTNFIRSN